jgi:hypothetical protein
MKKLMPRISLILFSLALFTVSCEKNETMNQDDVLLSKKVVIARIDQPSESNPLVVPVYISGNPFCNDLSIDYDYSSGKINYDGTFDGTFPAGFTVVVTDGKFVTWSYTPVDGMCLDGVSLIVKGGNGANVYTYPAGIDGDSGLSSPNNGGGNVSDLSNLSVCYNLVPCEGEKCYDFKGETAWAEGIRYVKKGNWATYTPYAEGTVTLFAGQTIPVGSASFSAKANGEVSIEINLDGDWVFADVKENVKIQNYPFAPSGNPAPGRFAHKGNASGKSISMVVPASDFYGIHLDVGYRVEVDCDEE